MKRSNREFFGYFITEHVDNVFGKQFGIDNYSKMVKFEYLYRCEIETF